MSRRRPLAAIGLAVASILQIHYAVGLALSALRGEPAPLILKGGSADFPAYDSPTPGIVVAAANFIWGLAIMGLAATMVFRTRRSVSRHPR